MRNKRSVRLITGIVLVVLVASMVAACGGSDDKEEEKTYTVGTLNFVPQLEDVVVGFKEGMAERGYVEGETITYISKSVPSPDQLDAAAQELVEAKVDLILATGTLEAQAVQRATSDIPIVFGVSSDPIGAGLVAEISQPGGNITGVMMPSGDQRRLQLMLDTLPEVKRIYVPYNPDDIGPAHMVEVIQEAASDLGVELVLVEVHNAEEAVTALTELPDDIDAIFVGPDDIVLTEMPTLIETSVGNSLPLSVPMAVLPSDLILMGYGPDIQAIGKQATNLADQILKETAPGELPVETGELFFTISLVAAEALNVEVTDAGLSKASTIIRPEGTDSE